MRFVISSYFFLFVFYQQPVYAQPKENWLLYYELINCAEILHIKKEITKADSVYQLAFKAVQKPFKEDYFLAAKNMLISKNYACVTEYLEKAIAKGLKIKRINSDSDFKEFKHTTWMKRLMNSSMVNNQNNFKASDGDLDYKIDKMVKKDQQIRGWRGLFYSSKRKNEIDRAHFTTLYEICLQSGWPGISKIGEDTPKGKFDVTENILLLVLHFSREEVLQLEPYMVDAVNNGEMYPYHYARAIDYKRIPQNGRQWYGTYFHNQTLIAIEDPDNVDKRRKAIGLEPIHEYILKRKQ